MATDDAASQGAAAMGRKRWAKATDAEKSAHGKKMARARLKKLSARKRSEIARKAGQASAAAREAARAAEGEAAAG